MQKHTKISPLFMRRKQVLEMFVGGFTIFIFIDFFLAFYGLKIICELFG